MGVKGLTDSEQPRYIKKIRLGIKGEKGVPQNVSHFVIEGAPEIEKVYGKKPTELHAMFYSDDQDETMPTWMEWYDASHFLLCRGDGNSKQNPGEASYRALHKTQNIPGLTSEPGFMRRSLKRTCLGEDCPDAHSRGCGIHSRILMHLPRVDPFQVYQVDTGSINTILDFKTALKSANKLKDIGSGMGTVFKLYKVDAKKGGLDSDNKKVNRKYKYMSCEISHDFWDLYGEEVIGKIRQIKGMNFIAQHAQELQQLSAPISEVRQQIQGSVRADQSFSENMEEPSEINVAPRPANKPDPTAKAAKKVNQTVDLENDPEIVAAVKAIYDSKGKPVPNNAVKNALAKYQNDKEALLEASKKALGTSPNRTQGPAVNQSSQQAPPPPTTKPNTQQQNGGTLL